MTPSAANTATAKHGKAGARHVGVVNRITRRATILVESDAGTAYSDGKRYLKFYIPLTMLAKKE